MSTSVKCDLADESTVATIVTALVPHATSGIVGIEVVSGGITNQLRKVTLQDGPPVLVRVFGAEGMIDRDIEHPTFEAVTEFLGRPICYGRFGNGRVEGWLEGQRPLDFDEMGQHVESIATAMAKLHTFEVPAALKPHYAEPGMWSQLWTWYDQAAAAETAAKINTVAADAAQLATIDLVRARDELTKLQAAIPADSAVAFCHNDLLAGNIMLDPASGAVTFIDFEYGGTNYRGFDIANHFNEWAGGTDDGEPDYSKFPTAEQQRRFCAAYLRELDGSDANTAALVAEASQFVLADHWYWGLWAVNQARDQGCLEFPYLTYAQRRIGQYYASLPAQ